MASSLIRFISEIIRPEMLKWLLDPLVTEWMLCWQALISLYISIITLGRPGALSTSRNILKRIFFFWAVSLHSGLKILSKPNCQQTCGHLGFVLPCMKHRQSRFSVILKGPGIFKRIKEHCLQLPLHWPLPGESNHPGFKGRLWLLSTNKSPRWYPLLIENGFVYIENTLFSAASFVRDPS